MKTRNLHPRPPIDYYTRSKVKAAIDVLVFDSGVPGVIADAMAALGQRLSNHPGRSPRQDDVQVKMLIVGYDLLDVLENNPARPWAKAGCDADRIWAFYTRDDDGTEEVEFRYSPVGGSTCVEDE